MSLLSGLMPAVDAVKLAERAVSALERIADELRTTNSMRDLELNGPRDYR